MITLLKLNKLECGVIRLQSQLYIGKDTADFILEDGIIKCLGYGSKWDTYYPYNNPYTIVDNIKEMTRQEL